MIIEGTKKEIEDLARCVSLSNICFNPGDLTINRCDYYVQKYEGIVKPCYKCFIDYVEGVGYNGKIEQ